VAQSRDRRGWHHPPPRSLGDIVFVRLPSRAGSRQKNFGTIVGEGGLRLRPVSGVTTINDPWPRAREGKDAHAAWMIKLKIRARKKPKLLSAATTRNWEESRAIIEGFQIPIQQFAILKFPHALSS
jgi:hypothetical protein